MNRWSLVATQDPIKKDGRADLFLDQPCGANQLHPEKGEVSAFRTAFFVGHYGIKYVAAVTAVKQ